jgi:hypothetical protein
MRSDTEEPVTISRLETWLYSSYDKNSVQSAPAFLLKYALDNITLTQ